MWCCPDTHKHVLTHESVAGRWRVRQWRIKTAPLDDELRKPFIKLLNSLEGREAAFTPQQRQHMGVWKLLVFLRLQLFTDDSFIFNKVARNIQVCLLSLKVSTSGLHVATTNCFALMSFAVTCRPAQVLV